MTLVISSAGCTTAAVAPAYEEEIQEKPIVPPESLPEHIPEEPEIPVEPSEPKSETDPDEYVMEEEKYLETLNELQDLVETLNSIIKDRNYDLWLTYLSPAYREYYSDPSVLRVQSDSPLLRRYGINLRSLRDYFNYVVVGSRQDVRLDDIKAIDENRVTAYMYINNQPIIIYELERLKGEWKIGKHD